MLITPPTKEIELLISTSDYKILKYRGCFGIDVKKEGVLGFVPRGIEFEHGKHIVRGSEFLAHLVKFLFGLVLFFKLFSYFEFF